jgi:hypothetical protein
MAAPVGAQERLDRMVRMIAADIVAEVCSAYVLRGEHLELFATEGLRPSAVPLCGSARAWWADRTHGGVVNLPGHKPRTSVPTGDRRGDLPFVLGVPIVQRPRHRVLVV